MDIVIKIAIVAAVILVGYNMSQAITAYASICDKVDEFRHLMAQSESSGASIRYSNFGLSLAISVAVVLLSFFSGLVWWITLIVACKAAVSLFCSDAMVTRIIREGRISKNFFILTKVDSVFNVVVGLAFAIILVM
ncbi:hypothetical protein [uncultured Fibrobacter sp.]|uniref:hypothetical protein n=1 Tax=uncultured Fibrobacter sp. TaxID=261512 RepID=UPI0025FF5D3E|nr:hypothetical protein [uncultured Fibrobacter sp.]